MRELAIRCRFADCTHLQEPDCAVQAAVAGGRVAPQPLCELPQDAAGTKLAPRNALGWTLAEGACYDTRRAKYQSRRKVGSPVGEASRREIRGVKSRLRTLFKRAADSGDAASAPNVESAFDKAAGKGIIHPNKAARKKARLAKAVRRTTAAPAKTAKGRLELKRRR